jgi:hypothetical protein
VEKGKSRQILRQFHLQELHKWGYKPGILFYFEAKLDGKELSTVEFGTRDGLAMAHLLTDYIGAFLQEAEIEKTRTGSTSTGVTSAAAPVDTSPAVSVGDGSATDIPSSSRKSSSNQMLTKSPSLPPPPPPPRPVSMSTSVSNPLKSSSAVTPVQQGQRQLTKSTSSSLGPSQATLHHHKCATKIQSLFRGYSLRNEWVKEDAVILIQAMYRGYAERCRVALMLEELFQSGQLELLDD